MKENNNLHYPSYDASKMKPWKDCIPTLMHFFTSRSLFWFMAGKSSQFNTCIISEGAGTASSGSTQRLPLVTLAPASLQLHSKTWMHSTGSL